MFTGIITDIGKILETEQRGDLRARIATNYNVISIEIGASIACDGVCLTVIEVGQSGDANWFDVEISAETLSKTKFGADRHALTMGKRINLERALRVGEELGGHIVSGHVDGVATVIAASDDGGSTRFTLQVPEDLSRFLAAKGSVALNGASLTVNDVHGSEICVNVIPHTKSATTWGDVQTGDSINLEIDTLARYVARLNDQQE